MHIKEAQKEIDHWIRTVGVRYFNELTNMAILTEEVGELARLVSREYGEQSFKEQISKEEIKERLSDEMGDIFFVLSCLANQMDIDLEQSFSKGMEKRTTRDSLRHKQNEKLK